MGIIAPRLKLLEYTDEEAPVEAPGSGSQSLDRLAELLNSMRSNSSGAERQLAAFMEEAQRSATSEETLARVVGTIYAKAAADRSFAATAAKLCDKMALFMVEGTKFRSLLLNLLQVSAPRGGPSSYRLLYRCSSEFNMTNSFSLI
ncbi:CBP80/20-dependent translation initiation factor [Liparis tanakae]|uniref:CBP80/20-dependent translation initiation factor n=1 Tax=Liparis tanakae TaxID=230148 RepID=A0A4Z2EC02_9TELE|nr:CBP80/20-dependent translation initiation factor [Liparis tanakae]